ncbi:MAG TPA: hypothetical protein VF395_02815 [Polyangiaceae bacterium]
MYTPRHPVEAGGPTTRPVRYVGMGGAVANPALGGMRVVHRKRAPLNAAPKSDIRLANRRGDP